MDAILQAGEITGKNLRPKDREWLVSYLWWLLKERPASFASLLGRPLPKQVTGARDGLYKARS